MHALGMGEDALALKPEGVQFKPIPEDDVHLTMNCENIKQKTTKSDIGKQCAITQLEGCTYTVRTYIEDDACPGHVERCSYLRNHMA